MRKVKQKPIPFLAEYRLFVAYKYSVHLKIMVVRVALRTIDEFSSFLYDIVVHDNIEGNTLNLSIQGLRPPRQTLPSFGPATFIKEYPNFKNIEEIVVTKLDGVKNLFQVKILRDVVKVTKSPENSFVQVVTKEEEW